MDEDESAVFPLKYDSSKRENKQTKERPTKLYKLYKLYKITRSIYISKDLWENWKAFADLLHTSASQLIEKAITEYMQTHADELPTKTLIQIFQPRQVNIDLSRRLELKLIKKDLMLVVNSLEKKGVQDYLMESLKELLPKAIRVYQKTSDPDLEALLKKTERWI